MGNFKSKSAPLTPSSLQKFIGQKYGNVKSSLESQGYFVYVSSFNSEPLLDELEQIFAKNQRVVDIRLFHPKVFVNTSLKDIPLDSKVTQINY